MKNAKRFDALFDGLKRGYGTYTLTGKTSEKGKADGRAITEHGDVTLKMWQAHLDGEQGLGIVPIRDDDCVMFAAIDIDEYDLDLEALEQLIHKKKFPLITVRSKSGGAHCYVFFKKPAKAVDVRQLLDAWALDLGRAGTEVFPKQDKLASENDIGNWLNMPYFNGDDTERYAIVAGVHLGLDQFLDYAESMRTTLRDVQVNSPPSEEFFKDGPPCLNAIVLAGIQDGMRNSTLLNLGVYARLRYDAEWPHYLDEYNNKYVDPPLGHTEVAAISKSLNKKKYFYTCTQAPLCNYCNKEICKKKKYGINSGEDIGVNIESLTKIESDPPSWIAQVNGERLELTTEELMSQLKFQAKCISTINYFPGTIKPHLWKNLLNVLLGTVRKIEAPPDAGPIGQLEFYVDQFCTVIPQGDVKDDLLQGKPWTSEGVTWFRSSDLFMFLQRRKFNSFTGTNLYIGLRKLSDVRHRQLFIKGKCVQLWGVPEHPVQDEDHPVKRIEDEGGF